MVAIHSEPLDNLAGGVAAAGVVVVDGEQYYYLSAAVEFHLHS